MIDGKVQPDVGAVNQPRTLFKPGSWLAKIDFINHLVLFNNVLITVLSEKEGGKTSFSSLVQNNLDQQIKPVFMTAKPPCEEKSIISNIAAQLHLNVNPETNIASIAAQINERKAHVLVVIDDAQNLPESLIKDVLWVIKNQDSFGFFHLCLVSDYSVVATLNNLAVDQFNNLIHTIELGPLNESETRTYVLQRAMTASLIHRPLTDSQFKQFYQLTNGNLAKINNSLESFINKCATQNPNNKLSKFKRTSLAVSLAVAAGVSYLYFSGMYNEHRYPEIAQLTATSPVESIVTSVPPLVRKVQPESFIASWQDSSTRQLVHYALPKKQRLDGLDDDEEKINTVAIVDKVVVIPSVKARKILIDTQLPAAQTAAVLESKLVKIKGFTANQVAQKTEIKKSATDLYTIQFAASHKISDIHRFKAGNKLFANAKIRHFKNAKGDWYILTLGEYDSRAVAQSSTNKLPPEVTKLKPWIRSVSGLSSVG